MMDGAGTPGRRPLSGGLDRQKEAEERLLSALRERSGKPGMPNSAETALCLVKSDAAVLAGLPADEAEAALRGLARDYRSHLAVTEQGELVYQFAPGLPRRNQASRGERLSAALSTVGSALWRGFTVAFKVWIAATLVLYTALFAVLAIALMVAGNGDDDGPGGIFLWWLLPDWGPRYGGSRRRRELDDGGPPRKRFYRSVFDFVFGPPQPMSPPSLTSGDDRMLLSYIREKQGRISASDLVLLTGWSYRRAEEEATRLLVQYDGEPEVADNGALVYAFRDLRRTVETAQTLTTLGALPAFGAGPLLALRADVRALTPFAWDQAESPPALTGNRGGTNAVITLLNGFNLVAALTIGALFAAGLPVGSLLALLLTVVPFLFSLIFFAVPAGRYLGERMRRQGRVRRNLRRALLWSIASRGGESPSPSPSIDPLEVVRLAVRRVLRGEQRMPGAAGTEARAKALLPLAHEELARLHRDLEGDVALPDRSAEAQEQVGHYTFPRLKEESEAVALSRKQAEEGERQVGEVIFSSASEGAGV